MKTIPHISSEDDKDNVVEMMKKNKIPLTRQNYLDIAFGRDAPDELHPEHEAMLPDMFKEKTE
jgi:hypothetical protein